MGIIIGACLIVATGFGLAAVGLLTFPWLCELVSNQTSFLADFWEWFSTPFIQMMPQYQESFGESAAMFLLAAIIVAILAGVLFLVGKVRKHR